MLCSHKSRIHVLLAACFVITMGTSCASHSLDTSSISGGPSFSDVPPASAIPYINELAASVAAISQGAYSVKESWNSSVPLLPFHLGAEAAGRFDFSSDSGFLNIDVKSGKAVVMEFGDSTLFYSGIVPQNAQPSKWTAAQLSTVPTVTRQLPATVADLVTVDPAVSLSLIDWGTVGIVSAKNVTFDGLIGEEITCKVDLAVVPSRASGPLAVAANRLAQTALSHGAKLYATVFIDRSRSIREWSIALPGIGLGSVTVTIGASGSSIMGSTIGQGTVTYLKGYSASNAGDTNGHDGDAS